MEIADVELRDRTVIGADGNKVGQVAALIVDSDTWSVRALRIKLLTDVAEQAGISRSLFRAGTIDLPIDHVQSVGDAVVLTVSAAGLRSAEGGTYAESPPAAP